MRGKWVSYDPREWSNLYEVSINVGLGNGNRQEQIAMLQMIMSKQEEIIGKYGANNPLVTVTQYRSTLGRMIEMAGFKDTTSFINEITPEVEQQIMQQASQAPADPNSEAAQLYAKVEEQKAQLSAQTNQAKLQLDREQMQVENARKELEFQQKQMQLEGEYRIKEAELQLKQMELEMKSQATDGKLQTEQLNAIMSAITSLNEMVKGGIKAEPQDIEENFDINTTYGV
jgi:hypothetical protein